MKLLASKVGEILPKIPNETVKFQTYSRGRVAHFVKAELQV